MNVLVCGRVETAQMYCWIWQYAVSTKLQT
jgi:hypothetical protein